ncbi:hypothetical protein [Tetragenococcus muriaticus]|uniref:Uncharacterized protein n=1 Tax=Tetragenococcus muriaticus 3MR10-3 TaxID=1302648 RepID=A0A091C6X1_9ENTE|nr:hypothetical protein [Tetragenococcus muriaticus]KFN92380.1 hypothetical protein TMU3MR103_0509 [Tetragenococcus muriaticus 3MR10-3]GMA47780.1 hypothetical protein GCM10025854_20300 [Tetragenococcus muriaticus]
MMSTGMGIMSMLSPILTYVALAAGIYAIIRLAVRHAINDTKEKEKETVKTKAGAFFTGVWFWLIVAVVVFILSMATSILPYMGM